MLKGVAGGRREDNLVTLTKAEALAYGGREGFQTLGGGSNGEGGSLRRSWEASLLGRQGFVENLGEGERNEDEMICFVGATCVRKIVFIY